jgi:hypothetical protein
MKPKSPGKHLGKDGVREEDYLSKPAEGEVTGESAAKRE